MGGGSPGAPDDEGGTSKKKRKGTTINLRDFPEWLNVDSGNSNQEIYVHIRAKDGDMPIARRNRFLVAKILKEKTNNITKASYNAQGDLILRIKGEKEAEKVLGMKAIGSWQISVEKHKTLNSSKGIIYSRDMCYLSDQEVKEGLSEYKVTEVFFFKRKPRDADPGTNVEPKPFGLGVLTFNTQEPPKRVRFGFEYLEVKPYVPNPKRCRKCQKLGHTTKWCKNVEEVCAECGQGKDNKHVCGIKMCVNCCKPGHASSSRDCPRFLMEKEIEAIKVNQKMTNFEAKKFFFRKYASLEGYLTTINKTMAQIVGGQSISQAAQHTKNDNSGKNLVANKADNTTKHPEENKSNQKTNAKAALEVPVQSSSNNTSREKPAQQNTNTTAEREEVVNKDNSTVSSRLGNTDKNNIIKLQNWKYSNTGITYILDNRVKGEGLPKVDFTRMKGHKTPMKEKIFNHAKEILGRQEVLKSIMEEIAAKKTCSKVVVKVERGVVRVTAMDEEEESASEGHSSMDEDSMAVEGPSSMDEDSMAVD